MEEKDKVNQENNLVNTEEQPKSVKAHTATAEEKDLGANNLTEGSSLGKFKDVESLMQAYKNLQAEFTRKSQKLSQASKQLENINDNSSLPVYEREDWKELVENFLADYPDAQQFADEISETILQDKVLKESKNPLEVAWAKVLSGKYQTPQKLLENENFVNEFIVNNKNVQEKVIQNYLTSLASEKAVPLISAHSGSSFSLSPKNKPKTLTEAKVLAQALFKN